MASCHKPLAMEPLCCDLAVCASYSTSVIITQTHDSLLRTASLVRHQICSRRYMPKSCQGTSYIDNYVQHLIHLFLLISSFCSDTLCWLTVTGYTISSGSNKCIISCLYKQILWQLLHSGHNSLLPSRVTTIYTVQLIETTPDAMLTNHEKRILNGEYFSPLSYNNVLRTFLNFLLLFVCDNRCFVTTLFKQECCAT